MFLFLFVSHLFMSLDLFLRLLFYLGTVLNQIEEINILILINGLRRNVFTFFPIQFNAHGTLAYCRQLLFCSAIILNPLGSFFTTFYEEGILNLFQSLFSASVWMIMGFIRPSFDAVHLLVCAFESVLYPQNEINLVMVYDPYKVFSNSVCKCPSEDSYMYVHESNWVVTPVLAMSLSGFGTRVMVALEDEFGIIPCSCSL